MRHRLQTAEKENFKKLGKIRFCILWLHILTRVSSIKSKKTKLGNIHRSPNYCG